MGTFVCGAKVVVQHTESSFLYHFNYGAPKPVIHSEELMYVFENGKLNAAGETLATAMGNFWESLAAVGRPGTEDVWPAYKNDTDSNIIFDSKLSIESGRRLKYCNFWLDAFSAGFQLPDPMGPLAKSMVPHKTANSVEYV